MAEQHNHDLDNKLHDKCPACDLIRDRHKRDKAVREARGRPESDP